MAIQQQLKPVVVHCSAGVGRTGAFCAAAICLQRLQEEGKMDLYQVTKHLRTQRPGMVQTAEQYAFVYRVAIDWLDQQQAAAAADSIYSTPSSARAEPQLPTFGEPAAMTSQTLDARLPPTSPGSTERAIPGGAPPARPAKNMNQ